jgi:hypothetical protein
MLKIWKNSHCSLGSSRVNVELVERSVTSCSIVKIVQFLTTMVAIMVTQLEECTALIVLSQAMSSRTASNEITRMADSTIIKLVTLIMVITAEKIMTHKMSYLQLRPSLRSSQMTYGSVIVETVDIFETQKSVCSRLKGSMRVSLWETIGISLTFMKTKFICIRLSFRDTGKFEIV